MTPPVTLGRLPSGDSWRAKRSPQGRPGDLARNADTSDPAADTPSGAEDQEIALLEANLLQDPATG